MRKILSRVFAVLHDWRVWALAFLVVIVTAGIDGQDRWVGSDGITALRLELVLYWGSWLLWPAALLLLERVVRHGRAKRVARAGLVSLMLLLSSGLIYSRFFELDRLEVYRTSLPVGCGVRVALLSDLHIGLFARKDDLERVVRRLNTLDVDAILVAGDWTYQPHKDLKQVFAPLAALKLRPYGVLGNHDESRGSGATGITEPLREALRAAGVRLIDNSTVPLGACQLTGIGDYLAARAQRELPPMVAEAAAHPSSVPRVMLTHEPVTVRLIPPGFAKATLVGHTHGAQIQIPWLSYQLLRHAMPGGWRAGLYSLPQTELFVTTGTGTDHAPVRFNVPPSIDIIEL